MPKQPFSIELAASVAKDYERIRDRKLLRGINRVLDEIKVNPYPFKKLSGPFAGLRSAPTFSFRIVFRVLEEKRVILVVAIDHRKQVYR